MKKNVEKAKVLMRGEWFTKSQFNHTMFHASGMDLPLFDEIAHLCEERTVDVDDCALDECLNHYNCENCPHLTYYKRTQYKFIDTPTSEECEEQLKILREFNLI